VQYIQMIIFHNHRLPDIIRDNRTYLFFWEYRDQFPSTCRVSWIIIVRIHFFTSMCLC